MSKIDLPIHLRNITLVFPGGNYMYCPSMQSVWRAQNNERSRPLSLKVTVATTLLHILATDIGEVSGTCI